MKRHAIFPAGQGVHVPETQTSEVGHAWPHAPQFSGSDWRSTQPEPPVAQQLVSEPQSHAPPLHPTKLPSSRLHWQPHAPQFDWSPERSTHCPLPQASSGAAHGAQLSEPSGFELHVVLAGQVTPQPPQFRGSPLYEQTVDPPHCNGSWLPRHWQAPDMHRPPAQCWPHAPQLQSSCERSVQMPPQSTRPAGQAHAPPSKTAPVGQPSSEASDWSAGASTGASVPVSATSVPVSAASVPVSAASVDASCAPPSRLVVALLRARPPHAASVTINARNAVPLEDGMVRL